MEEVKFNPARNEEINKFFDPTTGKANRENPHAKMVCICGFELVKESEDTYRCSGGSHRYNISQGQVVLDKFGNILLKMPEDGGNKNE